MPAGVADGHGKAGALAARRVREMLVHLSGGERFRNALQTFKCNVIAEELEGLVSQVRDFAASNAGLLTRTM